MANETKKTTEQIAEDQFPAVDNTQQGALNTIRSGVKRAGEELLSNLSNQLSNIGSQTTDSNKSEQNTNKDEEHEDLDLLDKFNNEMADAVKSKDNKPMNQLCDTLMDAVSSFNKVLKDALVDKLSSSNSEHTERSGPSAPLTALPDTPSTSPKELIQQLSRKDTSESNEKSTDYQSPEETTSTGLTMGK